MRWSLALVLTTGITSLVLAMIGLLHVWLALPLSVALAVPTSRFFPESTRPTEKLALAALMITVGAVVALGLLLPHEHILTTRDSGTYIATGSWLVEHHGLRMDVSDPAFSGVPVIYESVGFQARTAADSLQPQFMHMFPSLLALAASLGGGITAMYWVNPFLVALGLLCAFAMARKLVSDWMSVAATVLIAATMPFLYFSRAPFSEPLAFALLFGGIWVVTEAIEASSMRLATGAGLLLGAVTLARIDGVVVLLGLVVCRTLLLLSADDDVAPNNRNLEILERTIGVAIIPFALALVDLSLFSIQYLIDHGSFVASVLTAMLILFVIGRNANRLSRWFLRHRSDLARWVSVALAVYLTYSWVIRPHVESPTKSDAYGLEGLQQAAEVAVEPLRSYAELSVHWLSWYLGIPMVAMGLLGLVVLVRRMLLGDRPHLAPFLAITTTLTLLYIYRPSINPDQIWAMRRFFPLVIPAIIILGLAIAHEITKRLAGWAMPASVVLMVALALPIVLTSLRGGLEPELEGASHDVEAACNTLGDDALLLFVGDSAGIRHDAIGPLLRGACDIPVAAEDTGAPFGDGDLQRLADQAKSEGRRLWLIGETARTSSRTELFNSSYRYLELTLFEPPDEWLALDIHLWAEVTR